MKIKDSMDSFFYINTSVNLISLQNLVNCTVLVGAVNKICTISQCEKVTVCVASHFTRIISSVDTVVHSYSLIPPVLFGDNRSVTLAPHNASYP